MKLNTKNPVGAVLWLAVTCMIHIVLFRSKLDMNTPILQRLLFVILAIMVTLPLHEIIHCVFMKLFGLKGARIEFAKDPMGFPSLHAIAQGEVHGWKRNIILLAPFILLTAAPDLLFCLNERVHFLLFIVAMCNAAGCYFDVADVINRQREQFRG